VHPVGFITKKFLVTLILLIAKRNSVLARTNGFFYWQLNWHDTFWSRQSYHEWAGLHSIH